MSEYFPNIAANLKYSKYDYQRNSRQCDRRVLGIRRLVIVKGIVSLRISVLSGHTPQEILDADLYFIEKIGLKEHLSPTRSNGLVAMVKQMHLYAVAFRAKEME